VIVKAVYADDVRLRRESIRDNGCVPVGELVHILGSNDTHHGLACDRDLPLVKSLRVKARFVRGKTVCAGTSKRNHHAERWI
jgi:hypothetical protein